MSKDASITLNLKNPTFDPGPPAIDPATGKLKPTTVSAGILNGKASFLAPPSSYPRAAKEAEASGRVLIEILVDETGKVVRAGAISGHPLLQDAARDGACNSRFTPIRLSGNPIKVSGTLIYNFVM